MTSKTLWNTFCSQPIKHVWTMEVIFHFWSILRQLVNLPCWLDPTLRCYKKRNFKFLMRFPSADAPLIWKTNCKFTLSWSLKLKPLCFALSEYSHPKISSEDRCAQLPICIKSAGAAVCLWKFCNLNLVHESSKCPAKACKGLWFI